MASAPPSTVNVLHRILEFLNPRYHFRRAIEDLKMMRHAFKTRSTLGKTAHDAESLQQLFRGKLFSVFFISGPSGIVAATMAYGIQRQFRSPWMGLLATFVLAYVVTTIAYQIIWFLDNKVLYQQKGFVSKIKALERDLWPVHWCGLRAGFAFLPIVGSINVVVIGLMQFVSPQFAEYFPVPVIVFLVDIALVQAPFMRIMGDFFDRHSYALASTYLPAFGADRADQR